MLGRGGVGEYGSGEGEFSPDYRLCARRARGYRLLLPHPFDQPRRNLRHRALRLVAEVAFGGSDVVVVALREFAGEEARDGRQTREA